MYRINDNKLNMLVKKRADKIALLVRQKELIFHAQDLMVAWGIYNKNTLYTTTRRLIKSGSLYRIYKGMYSILPPSEIDPLLVGIKALHGFGYVSTETVLSDEGVINQLSSRITLIGEKSLKFGAAGHDYTCRKLRDKFLYNEIGITMSDGVRRANVERAVADMLYFNPKFHFDNRKLIDWKKVNELRKKIYDLA